MGHNAGAGSDGAWLAATLPEKNQSDPLCIRVVRFFLKPARLSFEVSTRVEKRARTQHHKLGSHQGLLNEFQPRKRQINSNSYHLYFAGRGRATSSKKSCRGESTNSSRQEKQLSKNRRVVRTYCSPLFLPMNLSIIYIISIFNIFDLLIFHSF